MTASSTTYWIAGLSTTGSISLGVAFVAGRKRVPSPAAGITALVIRVREVVMSSTLAPVLLHNVRFQHVCCGLQTIVPGPSNRLSNWSESVRRAIVMIMRSRRPTP